MTSARLQLNARWPGAGVALLAGLLSVASFAPFSQFWLAPVCMAVLFWLAQHCGPRRALLLGFAYGIGLFAGGTYWILIALSGVGGAPIALALALLLGLVCLLACFPALTLGASAWLAPSVNGQNQHEGLGWRLLVWMPLCWALVEWVRSWIFSGFPWLSTGYSQINSPLAGFAPVLGVFGVGLFVALTAGLMAFLAAHVLSSTRRMAPVGLAAAALVAVWLGGFGLGQIRWTHPVGPEKSVTLVQGDIDQQVKWSQDAVDAAIKRYSELTHGHWESDLIVWPETAIPDYYAYVKPALDKLATQLAVHHSTLLTGLLQSDPDTRDIYNSVVAVGDGQGLYAKRHLVPFGEYFPVPEIIRRWMAESGMPYADFTPGPLTPTPITASGLALGLSICYEDIFGALLARDVPPADVLINVSDDAWFGRSIGPDQHFDMARMRALETGRYLLRADNSAVTGIVDPRGRVVSAAPDFEPAVVTGTIRAYAGTTPYARWRDWGLVALLMVLAAIAATMRLLLRPHR